MQKRASLVFDDQLSDVQPVFVGGVTFLFSEDTDEVRQIVEPYLETDFHHVLVGVDKQLACLGYAQTGQIFLECGVGLAFEKMAEGRFAHADRLGNAAEGYVLGEILL